MPKSSGINTRIARELAELRKQLAAKNNLTRLKADKLLVKTYKNKLANKKLKFLEEVEF